LSRVAINARPVDDALAFLLDHVERPRGIAPARRRHLRDLVEPARDQRQAHGRSHAGKGESDRERDEYDP
jgi:hypothetical protein